MKKTSFRFRLPKSQLTKTLLSLAVTAVIGFGYFYVSLPALNFQSKDFYSFLALLTVVYLVSIFLLSGIPSDNVVRTPKEKLKEWLRFVKSRCLPVGILFVVIVAVSIVGDIISMPIFRAAAYRDLLTVEDGNFTADITQISYNMIPTLDRDSAEFLGDRQMGTLSDMVSQFEYSNDSTQINYQGRPVRVAPISYADLFKWFTNRGQGLPAYVLVDMPTQEATVIRLSEGMKYSFSEPLNRNIVRHLRFQFPTYMFDTPQFEIDENGQPWWIAPRVVKTIGLFGGTDIKGAVLCNAITGESQYYDLADIPTWVDNVFTPYLIMEQYDYHGTLVNGFINSVLGQRDVTVTTEGYNYIALNDDVYVYTGITSANADQSNLGFLLSNQRTKQTTYYEAPGATEYAAMASAQGVVQDLEYIATFPLLLNISGEPTYFIPLKDAANLVKSYAMVNVARYDIVATGNSVTTCEQEYIRMLADRGITKPEELPQTRISGTVKEIRTAVLEGTSYYFLRLEKDGVFYAINAADNREVVTLNMGDSVTIDHAILEDGSEASILDGYTLTIDKRVVTPDESASAPGFTVDGQSVPFIPSGSGLPFHFQTVQAEPTAPVDPADITVVPAA